MRQKGTVKWFNEKKSFGFIKPDDDSADVFVHISALQKAKIKFLNEGDRVEYELLTVQNKASAENLQVLSTAPSKPKSYGNKKSYNDY